MYTVVCILPSQQLFLYFSGIKLITLHQNRTLCQTGNFLDYWRKHLMESISNQWRLVVKMAGRAANFHLWLNI